MQTYGLVVITEFDFGVGITSTKPDVISWLLTEAKDCLPSFQVGRRSKTIPSGKECHVLLEKFPYPHDYSPGWWVVSRLCEDGWEPFAVEGTAYYFRKEMAD